MYKLGTHSAAVKVPKFFKAKTFRAMLHQVRYALDQLPEEITKDYKETDGLAAYIWYSRSNHNKTLFCPLLDSKDLESLMAFNKWQNDIYKELGVYDIDPQRLLKVKRATIVKYTKLLYPDYAGC